MEENVTQLLKEICEKFLSMVTPVEICYLHT